MSEEKQPYILFENSTALGRPTPLPPETTATPIYYLNLTAPATASHVSIVPLTSEAFGQPTMVTISMYNDLLSLYMARGDEIARLQARIAELERVFEVPPEHEMMEGEE